MSSTPQHINTVIRDPHSSSTSTHQHINTSTHQHINTVIRRLTHHSTQSTQSSTHHIDTSTQSSITVINASPHQHNHQHSHRHINSVIDASNRRNHEHINAVINTSTDQHLTESRYCVDVLFWYVVLVTMLVLTSLLVEISLFENVREFAKPLLGKFMDTFKSRNQILARFFLNQWPVKFLFWLRSVSERWKLKKYSSLRNDSEFFWIKITSRRRRSESKTRKLCGLAFFCSKCAKENRHLSQLKFVVV
jgi:hypothetical protein